MADINKNKINVAYYGVADELSCYINKWFREQGITVISNNAAKAGEFNTQIAAKSVEADLKLDTEDRPDVLFMDLALKDHYYLPDNCDKLTAQNNFDSIIRQLFKSNSEMQIFVLYTADWDTKGNALANGTGKQQWQHEVANYYNLPEIYVSAKLMREIYNNNGYEWPDSKSDKAWAKYFNGDIPNAEGYKAYADRIIEKLLRTEGGNRIDISKTDNFEEGLPNVVKRTGYAEAEAEVLRRKILATKNTDISKAEGTIYYFSNKGDDNNDGLTEKTAKKTAEAIASLELKAGDFVLFERGSLFRNSASIMCVSGVTYGAYGDESLPKPILVGSPKDYAKEVWEKTDIENIWKMNFPYTDMGTIIFDNEKKVGCMRYEMESLKKNTDFYHDREKGAVYLYCKGNPSEVYFNIEMSSNKAIFFLNAGPTLEAIGVSDVTVDNLCLKYSGEGGVSGINNNSNITVTNCEMGFIGGINLYGSDVRMGNAITLWNGLGVFIVENNWIYQTFDAAISPQGGKGLDYSHISFCNNLLEYNGVDYEWYDHDHEGNCPEWKNVEVDNNIIRFTSHGWGNRITDHPLRGIEGCLRGDTTKIHSDRFSIQNNIFDCPAMAVISWYVTKEQLDSTFVTDNNILYLDMNHRRDGYNKFSIRGLDTRIDKEYYDNITNEDMMKYIWRYFNRNDDTSKVYFYKA